jgi:GNAT superfamily N-acetyltransferase
VAEVVEARTKSRVASAKSLIEEYSTSLGIDLGFDRFDSEMAEFPGAYARPAGRLLLAIERDDAAGVVALRKLSENTCEMKRLYVRPDFRGKGIGRKLATRVIQEARGIGYSRMRLDTLSSLKEAVSLYESLGFRRIAPYRFNPHEGVVYMELSLKAK